MSEDRGTPDALGAVLQQFVADVSEQVVVPDPPLGPATGMAGVGTHGPDGTRTRTRVAVAVLAAVVVAAAVVLVVYGPRSGRPGSPGLTPVTQAPAVTSTTPSPATTVSPTTTVAPSPSTTVGAAAVGTRQITYEPFTAKGTVDPALHVTSTQTASTCEAGGVAGNASFRCFAQSGGILDPCFAAPGATTGPVLCPSGDPAADNVVRLDVGTLATSASGMGAARVPWAMHLSNGQSCVFVNAAWGGLGPFGCQNSASGPAVGGPADCRVPLAATPWWTTTCQATLTDASPFVSYRVEVVWS